jgi:hypothetical protein
MIKTSTGVYPDIAKSEGISGQTYFWIIVEAASE